MRVSLSNYKKRALDNNFEMSLSKQDVKYFRLGDCHYCGVSNLFLKYYCEILAINTPWMTLDRKDNSKGYTKDNVVSACFLCNKIKGSFFTYGDMLRIGKEFVAPKLKVIEKEACEAYQEWCDMNVYYPDDDDYDISTCFPMLTKK